MLNKYQLFSLSISSIYHDIQRIERKEMAAFGLKGPHAQCLLAMSRHPQGITSSRLCELCEKDKAAISRTVSELIQAGLVQRGSSQSRYRVPLTLTEQGIAAAQAVSIRAVQAVERAGAGLEDSQREIFYQVLGLIARNLHDLCKEDSQNPPNKE